MKRKTLLFTFAATLALGLAGCSKNESATSTAEDANKAAISAADAAAKTAEASKVEAQKAADSAKAESAKAAEAEATRVADAAKVEAAKTAEAAKAADNAKTEGLIEKAKNLIADGKLSDASSVLQQLTGKTLSVDQMKLVESLKEQIQKALAAKAAGNLLK